MNPAMRIKKLLRPMIPDGLMARYRLAQHSRQVRTNVDVVITDRKLRRRWLGTTPDTYRAVLPPAPEASPELAEAIEAYGTDVARAIELLAVPDAEVGVVARVAPPRIVGRRRVEPPMEPIAIAATAAVISEVGGAPPGSKPLQGLLARLRDAGRRLALLPIPADAVDARRSDPIPGPPVVILSAVPLNDIGGGSRGAQLAFAFLRAGFHVTYVAMHGTQESVDLGIRYVHPNLEQYRADDFDAQTTVRRSSRRGLALVEVPAAVYRGAVEALGANSWAVLYDSIDDWSDPALGGDWYNGSTERWMVEHADVVVGSAPDLIDRARRFGASAHLVPNAVNADVFGPVVEERPHDLPSTNGPTLGYCGSLYGDWFDWDALRAVALDQPDAAVVVIGDDRGVRRDLPGNVAFLGLKVQGDLPAYVQRFDVGLLPFHVTETTHAVSPLKVYEYLASGVPVAAPPLRSLAGLDGVFQDVDLTAAVRRALAAPPPDRHVTLGLHSWRARVDDLIRISGLSPPEEEASPMIVVRRPPAHYGRPERDVKAGAGRLVDP